MTSNASDNHTATSSETTSATHSIVSLSIGSVSEALAAISADQGHSIAQDTSVASLKDQATLRVDVQLSDEDAKAGLLEAPLVYPFHKFVRNSIRNQDAEALSAEFEELKTQGKSENMTKRVQTAVDTFATMAKTMDVNKLFSEPRRELESGPNHSAQWHFAQPDITTSLPKSLRIPENLRSEDYAYDVHNWVALCPQNFGSSSRVSGDGHLEATLTGLVCKETEKIGDAESFDHAYGIVHPWGVAAAMSYLYPSRLESGTAVNGWAKQTKQLIYQLHKHRRFGPIIKTSLYEADDDHKVVEMEDVGLTKTIGDLAIVSLDVPDTETVGRWKYELQLAVPKYSWVGGRDVDAPRQGRYTSNPYCL